LAAELGWGGGCEMWYRRRAACGRSRGIYFLLGGEQLGGTGCVGGAMVSLVRARVVLGGLPLLEAEPGGGFSEPGRASVGA